MLRKTQSQPHPAGQKVLTVSTTAASQDTKLHTKAMVERKVSCPASPTAKEAETSSKLENRMTAPPSLGSSMGSPKPKRFLEGLRGTLRTGKSKSQDGASTLSKTGTASDAGSTVASGDTAVTPATTDNSYASSSMPSIPDVVENTEASRDAKSTSHFSQGANTLQAKKSATAGPPENNTDSVAPSPVSNSS